MAGGILDQARNRLHSSYKAGGGSDYVDPYYDAFPEHTPMMPAQPTTSSPNVMKAVKCRKDGGEWDTARQVCIMPQEDEDPFVGNKPTSMKDWSPAEWKTFNDKLETPGFLSGIVPESIQAGQIDRGLEMQAEALRTGLNPGTGMPITDDERRIFSQGLSTEIKPRGWDLGFGGIGDKIEGGVRNFISGGADQRYGTGITTGVHAHDQAGFLDDINSLLPPSANAGNDNHRPPSPTFMGDPGEDPGSYSPNNNNDDDESFHEKFRRTHGREQTQNKNVAGSAGDIDWSGSLNDTVKPAPAFMGDPGMNPNDYYAQGGGITDPIHINPNNKGKFTATANRMGMGVQQAARHILANPDDYSGLERKRANFARNAAGWNHKAEGGEIEPRFADEAHNAGLPIELFADKVNSSEPGTYPEELHAMARRARRQIGFDPADQPSPMPPKAPHGPEAGPMGQPEHMMVEETIEAHPMMARGGFAPRPPMGHTPPPQGQRPPMPPQGQRPPPPPPPMFVHNVAPPPMVNDAEMRAGGGIVDGYIQLSQGGFNSDGKHPYYAGGGFPGHSRGTDQVPTWLTEGEFVVNRQSAARFAPQLEQMNKWQPNPRSQLGMAKARDNRINHRG